MTRWKKMLSNWVELSCFADTGVVCILFILNHIVTIYTLVYVTYFVYYFYGRDELKYTYIKYGCDHHDIYLPMGAGLQPQQKLVSALLYSDAVFYIVTFGRPISYRKPKISITYGDLWFSV